MADRDLLPGIHVLDSGSVDADFLVTAQTPPAALDGDGYAYGPGDWLALGEPLGVRRQKPGHFAQLAPHPLSRQTVLC